MFVVDEDRFMGRKKKVGNVQKVFTRKKVEKSHINFAQDSI